MMSTCVDPIQNAGSPRPSKLGTPVGTPVTVEIVWSTITDPGLQRETNEDRAAAFSVTTLDPNADANVLVVADGMGAEAGGARAAQTMVDSFSEAVKHSLALAGLGQDHHQLGVIVEEAITASNASVRTEQRMARLTHRHMATTCACVLICGGRAAYANVGDSRIYLMRHGHLNQLSVDHSLIWDIQERAGSDSSQFRRSITRGIGFADHVNPDIGLLTLQPGDRLVVCSDGLTNYASDLEIGRILAREGDPVAACAALLEAANRTGGGDNITVIVCRYGSAIAAVADEFAEDETDQDVPETQTESDAPERFALIRSLHFRLLVLLICILVAAFVVQKKLENAQADAGHEEPAAPRPAANARPASP